MSWSHIVWSKSWAGHGVIFSSFPKSSARFSASGVEDEAVANESFHATPFVIRWKGANKFQERAEEKEILAVEKGKMIPSRSRRIALTCYARSESPTFEEPFFISFPDFRDRSRLVTLKCSAYAAMIIGHSGLQTRPVKVSTNRRKLIRFIHATPNTTIQKDHTYFSL